MKACEAEYDLLCLITEYPTCLNWWSSMLLEKQERNLFS